MKSEKKSQRKFQKGEIRNFWYVCLIDRVQKVFVCILIRKNLKLAKSVKKQIFEEIYAEDATIF